MIIQAITALPNLTRLGKCQKRTLGKLSHLNIFESVQSDSAKAQISA